MTSKLGALCDRWSSAFTGRSSAFKIVAAGAILLITAIAALWLFDKLLILATSRSYVDQIAYAFNLNRHLAEAISLGVFVLLCYFLSKLFSFSAFNRRVGYAGLMALLIANSIALWRGTKDQFFEASGTASKCYVMTRDGVRYLEKAGIDPISGKKCTPVTPEAMDKLLAYSSGRRPERVDAPDPVFFDPRTGEPSIWFARGKTDEIELFDLMGFHPETGQELVPVRPEIVAEWKRQQRAIAERPPQRINPEAFAFFDAKSGRARGWYWRSADGEYEFFDNAGFQPNTGDRLQPVTNDVLAMWREASSRKCYVLTRSSIRYGSRIGPDAATGSECRPITASILERLREYEKGNRPKLINSSEPMFFDPRSGDPAVWYGKDASGQIQFFDLIGFHPDTGQELLPVDPAIVIEWRRQMDIKSRRPPQLVDINRYAPFDPVDGKPRVWFWRGREGMWEFYDNDGFQPGTGEKLTLISRDALQAWVREGEDRKRREVETAARIERQRLATEAAAVKAQEEADRLKREREAQVALEQQSGDECDRVAANPTDARRPSAVDGVEYNDLKTNPQQAIAACLLATRKFASEPRYKYQLARALENSDPKRALLIYQDLARQNYAAAFDNWGGILLRENKDIEGAKRLYAKGVQMGDPGAMVSVAYLIKRGYYQTPNADPEAVRFNLLSRAAEKGHRVAREMLESEHAAYQQKLQDQQNQQQAQRMMLNFFGTAVGTALGR